MSTIYTRATKGSALTWTEGDANITNLNNDKIEDIVEDTTPQLGGNLDVNGNAIVSASNGNIRVEPNGSGNIALTPTSGKIILGALDFPTGMGTNGQVLTTNGSSAMTWSTPSTGLTDVVNDTTPQLGGNLDVNGKDITSASNGNINIAPNGSGNIQLTPATGKITLGALDFPTGMGTNGQVLTTNGSSAMSWSTVSGGATTLDELTDVVITAAATNDILRFDGTNWVDTAASTLTVGTATVGSTVTLTADNATNATNYPLFVNAATGNLSPRTDTGFVYNPSTGVLGATQFNGIHNGAVGSVTPSTGAFTTLSASNTATFTAAVSMNPASSNVTISPTGTGSVSIQPASTLTINSTAGGTINNCSIGATTASTGRFTTVTSTVATGTAPFTVASTTNVANLNASSLNGATFAAPGAIGSTTASTGAFTTLSASGVATLGGTAFPSATGTTGQVLALSAAGTAAWTTASSGGASTAWINMTNFQATLISGNFYRTGINEVSDVGSIVSITSDQFQLAAGTYVLTQTGHIRSANSSWYLQLYNVTSSASVDNLNGLVAYKNASNVNTYSLLGWTYILTVPSTRTYEIRCNNPGVDVTAIGNAVYLSITKIA